MRTLGGWIGYNKRTVLISVCAVVPVSGWCIRLLATGLFAAVRRIHANRVASNGSNRGGEKHVYRYAYRDMYRYV